MNISTKKYCRWLGFVSITILTFSLLYLNLNPFDESHLRHLIAWSAKLSAATFCLAFSASAINEIFQKKWSAVILAKRDFIGLTFANLHLAHLIFLFILQFKFHPVFEMAKTSSLLGGGMAYVFILAMVVTTFPRPKKAISSKNWMLLHKIGSYWIWFIFFRSYARNVFTKGEEQFLFSLICVTIMLRIYIEIKRLMKK